MSGKVLRNRWRLDRTIGKGAQGKVKLAYDLQENIQVAVKLCKKLPDNTKLLREIEYLRKLQHPNVIRLFDAFEEEDAIIMVLELGKRDLFDVLEAEKAVDESLAKGVFRQLIAGIGYCHSHNVVHRDLKPENLLLNGDLRDRGQVKICDFGLSNAIHGDSPNPRLLRTLCGSDSYAAPEIFLQRGYYGPPVDVWSAAIILYNMVTGFSPWYAAVAKDEVFGKFCKSRKEFWRWTNKWAPKPLSAELMEMLEHMMQPDPSNRATVEEVQKYSWHGPVEERPVRPDIEIMVTDDGGEDTIDMEDEPTWRSGPALSAENFEENEVTWREVSSGCAGDKELMDATVEAKWEKNCLRSSTELPVLWELMKKVASPFIDNLVVKEQKYKIKGDIRLSESITVPMQVDLKIMPASCEGKHVIRVQKCGGDYLQFRKLFCQLRNALGPHVEESQCQ